MFQPVSRNEIADRVKHIRDLHRQVRPNSESEVISYALREQKTKDLLSNLQRMAIHPTLQLAYEFGRLNSMNTDSAHGLFGYHLDAIRDFDLRINNGRTHIIESYVFRRDKPVELPLELAPAEAFSRTARLGSLIRQWQDDIPIRALDRPGWKRPGTYYVHVGTQDSLGSDVPPGSVAQVQALDRDESQHPNPRAIYLLQFANGYRCSRCVITRGRLHLITSERTLQKAESFAHPLAVRIVGRVRVVALKLPMPDYRQIRSLSEFEGSAPLILPWEQSSRHELFAAKYKRFVRPPAEREAMHSLIEQALGSSLSERSKRRYRADSASEPHIDAMIHMTLEHVTRYTDSLRSGGFALRGGSRFSLDALLSARHYRDLLSSRRNAPAPFPREIWEERQSEIGEWPTLASLMMPRPSLNDDNLFRLTSSVEIHGLNPRPGVGSWLSLEPAIGSKELQFGQGKRGWSRPLYALQRGLELLIGHVDPGEGIPRLISNQLTPISKPLSSSELPLLRRICGAVIPV